MIRSGFRAARNESERICINANTELSVFFQTGLLSIVVPPDFISEATSSDVMVGEGGQVLSLLYFKSL